MIPSPGMKGKRKVGRRRQEEAPLPTGEEEEKEQHFLPHPISQRKVLLVGMEILSQAGRKAGILSEPSLEGKGGSGGPGPCQ